MDDASAPRLYLDEVIAPHRSLPKQGFIVLLSLVILVNLIVGTMFVMMGAGPIPIFLGLDILAVVIAFRVSYGRAKSQERVQVTADRVRVVREGKAGAQEVWVSPTAFTRVDVDRTSRHGAEVRLSLSGKRLLIAQTLGPRQRIELAGALEKAIREARAERHPA